MKPVLSALCILTLIPVAASASEGHAAEKSPRARCLEQIAARSADYAVAGRLRRLEAARLGSLAAGLDASLGHGVDARGRDDRLMRGVSAGSRIHHSAGTFVCEQLSDTPRATASRADQPRRFRAARGGVNSKAGQR